MPAFAQENGGSLSQKQVQALARGIKPCWAKSLPAADNVPPYLPQKGGRDPGRGAKVYARACASCHGNQGQGGDHHGQEIGAINDRSFLALTSDQALRRYIITGRPDLGMPDFAATHGRSPNYKPLTSEEIDDLVALLAAWRQGSSVTNK
jgi:mono/diheme cytochrome c family protein